MLKDKVIAVRLWNESQSWWYELMERRGGQIFRVLIKRGNTDDESFVKGYHLDDKWKLVIALPISFFYCAKASPKMPRAEIEIAWFEDDAATIVAEMEQLFQKE